MEIDTIDRIAFLATRSVSEVVDSSVVRDKEMKEWLTSGQFVGNLASYALHMSCKLIS